VFARAAVAQTPSGFAAGSATGAGNAGSVPLSTAGGQFSTPNSTTVSDGPWPPSDGAYRGELAVFGGALVTVSYDRPVELAGARLFDRRTGAALTGPLAVSRLSPTSFSVGLPQTLPSSALGLTLENVSWRQADQSGYQRDVLALRTPVRILAARQAATGGVRVELDVCLPGTVVARLRRRSAEPARPGVVGRRTLPVAGRSRPVFRIRLDPPARRRLRLKGSLSLTLTLRMVHDGGTVTVQQPLVLSHRAKRAPR